MFGATTIRHNSQVVHNSRDAMIAHEYYSLLGLGQLGTSYITACQRPIEWCPLIWQAGSNWRLSPSNFVLRVVTVWCFPGFSAKSQANPRRATRIHELWNGWPSDLIRVACKGDGKEAVDIEVSSLCLLMLKNLGIPRVQKIGT